ncbi:MAG: phage tail protein [Mucilaginibacter sp.]
MDQLITIYAKGTRDIRAIVDPDEQSAQDNGIMKGDIIKLSFTDDRAIQFVIGDYCTIFGNNYQVNQDVPFTKTAQRKYAYTITLEGDQYDLTKTSYLFLDADNNFTEAKFSLLEKPIGFMNLLVANLNRRDPGAGWNVGIVDDADYTNLTFDSQNCLQVLQTLSQTFFTEYTFDGKTINLTTQARQSGVTLQYGKGQALFSLERQNAESSGSVSMFTRLYAYGSNRNIGSNYRNGAKYLRMADSLYMEKNANIYGVFEKVIYFDGQQNQPEIYPQHTGTVTAVTSPFIFTDINMPFNLNDHSILIPGVSAQVTFNSGLLAGYTFDVGAFDSVTKTFTINANTSSQTVVIPSVTLTPAVGDTYVIINIILPLAYVQEAEAKLLVAAKAYMKNYGPAKLQYPVGCNPIYFKENALELKLGYTYRLIEPAMNIDKQSRVVSYTRNLRNPWLYKATLADKAIPMPAIIKLINSI